MTTNVTCPLSGPGIYRTANGRHVTWSVGNIGFRFGGKLRVILLVASSGGDGEFSLTYGMDGTPCDGFRPACNTDDFRIVSRAEA